MAMPALVLLGIGVAGALSRVVAGPGVPDTGTVVQSALADGTATMLVAALGWTVLVAAAGRLTRLPGRVGTWAEACWDALVPAAARVALGAAIGVQGMSGTAFAVTDHEPTAVSHPVVARPGTGADVAVAETPATHDRPAPVTVLPGDSLWRIAERHLGNEAPVADVAAEWPRWYQANSRVIGPDPNLLAVGVVLSPPPAPLGNR